MPISLIETASLDTGLVAPTATALTTASGSAPSYSAPLVGSFRLVNYHAANSALGDSTYNSLAVFR